MMRSATTAQMQTERFERPTPKESVSESGMREVVTQSTITPPTKLELFEEIIPGIIVGMVDLQDAAVIKVARG